MRRFFLALPLLTVSAPAFADDRCATGDVDLAWQGTDLAQISGDTGWFPSGYAGQLRLTGRIAGETAVNAGLTAKACWDGEQMSATAAGRAGTGYLDVAYGAETHLYAKIDTSILGKSIYWEGEIPMLGLPNDLLVGGTTKFDPAVGATSSVYDTTSPITLLSTDVIGDLIGITGISGGLRITVTGAMTTSYTPTAMAPNGVAMAPGANGYGGAVDVPASVDGVVHYAPQLVFGAAFDVKILGIRVVNWQFASVGLPLPGLDRPMQLTAGAPAHVGLPDLDGLGAGARIDFASGPTQELTLRNRGEAPLVVDATGLPSGITVEKLTIPPGADGKLRVTAADGSLATMQTITVSTNDPDRHTASLDLGKDVGGTDPGDSPEDAAAKSSGCSAASDASLGTLLLVVGVLITALSRGARSLFRAVGARTAR
jgi:hypothetical protein